jgi:hypothetical protein
MALLAHNPEVVSTELEDGAVLLNMETKLYYSLNQVGLELWRLLDAPVRPEDVSSYLTQGFEIDEQHAQNSASTFLRALERARLAIHAGEANGQASTGASSVDGEAPPSRRPFVEPELIQHDEPLHEVAASPFDPQLPLAE